VTFFILADFCGDSAVLRVRVEVLFDEKFAAAGVAGAGLAVSWPGLLLSAQPVRACERIKKAGRREKALRIKMGIRECFTKAPWKKS
jgi:hypothetical protein